MVSKGFVNLVISAKSEIALVSFVKLPVLDVFSYQMINFVKVKHSEVEPDNFPNFLDVHDYLLTHMIVPHFLQFSGYDCSSFSSVLWLLLLLPYVIFASW